MNEQYQSGTVEVAIGKGVLTPDRLGDVAVNFQEGTRSGDPLSGNVTLPSRRFDERTITFPLFLRGVDELEDLWPEYYNKPTGSTNGNITVGTGACNLGLSVINIHPVCEPDSRADFQTKGTVSITWNPSYSGTGLLQTEVTIYCQDLAQGTAFKYGAGDLTEDSLWDAETQAYVPVESA